MNIVGIEKLYYGVEDMDASICFHEELGMERADSGRSGADFRMRNNTFVHLRPADDASLAPSKVKWLPHLSRSTMREVVWGVDNAQTLEAIGAELGKDRDIRTDAAGILHTTDDGGLPVGFMVTQGKPVSLEPAPVNTVGTYGRLNRQAEAAKKKPVGPYRAGHVVFWMPGDLVKPVNFYVKRLGFR